MKAWINLHSPSGAQACAPNRDAFCVICPRQRDDCVCVSLVPGETPSSASLPSVNLTPNPGAHQGQLFSSLEAAECSELRICVQTTRQHLSSLILVICLLQSSSRTATGKVAFAARPIERPRVTMYILRYLRSQTRRTFLTDYYFFPIHAHTLSI